MAGERREQTWFEVIGAPPRLGSQAADRPTSEREDDERRNRIYGRARHPRRDGRARRHVHLDPRRQRQHLGGHDPPAGDRRGRQRLGQHPAMGGDRLLAGRRGVHRHVRCVGRRVRASQDLPRRPAAVHRVLRPDRALRHPDRRDPRALHPGCRRLDDPGVRTEPADGGVARVRAAAGGLAVGRSVCGRGRRRTARRWSARRLDRLAGTVLDRRRYRRGLHPGDDASRSRNRATRTVRGRSTGSAPCSWRRSWRR